MQNTGGVMCDALQLFEETGTKTLHKLPVWAVWTELSNRKLALGRFMINLAKITGK